MTSLGKVDDKRISTFLKALQDMANAQPQNSRKNQPVIDWFKHEFDAHGRGSIVTEKKQVGNRVVEQFKHRASHVVFVMRPTDLVDALTSQVLARDYPALESVLLIQEKAFAPKLLMTRGSSDVAEFYRQHLKIQGEIVLSPLAAQAGPDYAVLAPEWRGVELAAPDPCGLVSLELPMARALTALKAGKHVVFVGAPGTGKTELAMCLCQKLGVPYDVATATSDWTTFDTIGGYFPAPVDGDDSGGALDFVPAIVLRAIERDHWLIIDEMNRADIDKAFGELFTLLSHVTVRLPFRKRVDEEYRDIYIAVGDAATPADAHIYEVSPEWRILGTMNTFDKASLFQLSFAFMRRFAFVDVDLPPPAQYAGLIDAIGLDLPHLADDSDIGGECLGLIKQIFAPGADKGLHALGLAVGPAIALDVVRYADTRLGSLHGISPVELVLEALEMYLYPQFEGRDKQHEAITAAIKEVLQLDEARAKITSSRLASWTGFVPPRHTQ